MSRCAAVVTSKRIIRIRASNIILKLKPDFYNFVPLITIKRSKK